MRVHDVGRGPLFGAEESAGAQLQRRTKGIAIELGGLVALTLLFPLFIAGAALVDLALWVVRRKPWMAVRLAAFAWWFLFGELRCYAGLRRVYLITGGRPRPRRGPWGGAGSG